MELPRTINQARVIVAIAVGITSTAEIRRQTGEHPRTIQRTLAQLTSAGLVTRVERWTAAGRCVTYRAALGFVWPMVVLPRAVAKLLERAA